MRHTITRNAVFFIGALLSTTACHATIYSYGFDNTTGSGFPGTALSGNDNWVVNGAGMSVRSDAGAAFAGMTPNVGYRSGNGDNQGTRANDGVFSFAIPSGHDRLQLSFNVRARNNGSYQMAFALADGGLGGEVGPQFGLTSNNWFIRQADFGSQTNIGAGLSSTSEGYLVVLDMDLTANGGDGSGSLSVQNLENPGPLTPIAGLQNINLEILNMDGGSSDPSTWDNLYIRLAGGGATIDNLTINNFVTPEPVSAVLALFGILGCVVCRRRRRA